jgi:hypothetical protein
MGSACGDLVKFAVFRGAERPKRFALQFQSVSTMDQPVQHGISNGGIAEHLWMPQRLTGESLRSGSSIRIIPCMASAFRSATDGLGGGPALIVIRLPDGRERAISRSATAVASASDDRAAPASRQAHISVRTLLPLANHVRAVLASRHADLEGGGARDHDQTPAEPDGVPDAATTPVATAFGRDTTPACAAGGTARAASAGSLRRIRGGSSC